MKDRANQLADLVERLLAKIEEEMNHGCYMPPPCVPVDYEDEGDAYYENHDRIVNETSDLWIKVRELIAKTRKGE